MAEPNDGWQDVPDDEWVDVPEGGAGGRGGSDTVPQKQLIRPPKPPPEETPVDRSMRERYEGLSRKVDMSRGGALGVMSPDDRQFYENYRNQRGLGRGIAFARGVPLVGGHIDELSAALQTKSTSGPEYEKKLQGARGAVNAAVSDNPALPLIGSLAFAPGAPSTALGRVGLGTAAGVSEGVGSAPTMGKSVRPAIVGGAFGLGTSLLGELAIGGGNVLGAKKADVITGARAATDKSIDKAFASSRGAYGGNVSNGANLLESAERAAVDQRLPELVRKRAAEWLDSPEAIALREQVALSNLGRGEDALARISRSKAEMAEKASSLTPEARAAAAETRLNDPTAFLRRARELAPKVVLPAVGGALLGPLGAGAGGLAGAALGKSATTLKNAITDPYVASRLLGAGEAALGGAGRAISSSAPTVSREALKPYLELLEKEEEKPQ